MVLYYYPMDSGSEKSAKVKGVLIGMGVRIKNITIGQSRQQVGYLAGLAGFSEENQQESLPFMEEEILVMKNFTGNRVDELLFRLRKAGIPKIELKAVITETNSHWSFYRLYQEIKDEHDKMSIL